MGKIKKFTILYNPVNEQVFREAFKQSQAGLVVKATGAHVAGASGVAAAGVSNTLLESGLEFDLWPSQRYTDTSDWDIYAEGLPHKAVFQQSRDPLEAHVAVDETSDYVRDTGNKYMQWESRMGFSCSIPYSAIRING